MTTVTLDPAQLDLIIGVIITLVVASSASICAVLGFRAGNAFQ